MMSSFVILRIMKLSKNKNKICYSAEEIFTKSMKETSKEMRLDELKINFTV